MKKFKELNVIMLVLLSMFFIGACTDSNNQNDAETDSAEIEQIKLVDSITFKWETAADLLTPESVKYDELDKILYVANINNDPSVKDKNGFISKVSLDGEIIDLKWVTGLSAPKGMGIFDRKLYVTDIDRLVEISIENGKILKDYPVKEAKFLNDIDIDKEGNVYVTDMASDKIYRLDAKGFNVWLQSVDFDSPNGLFVEDNNLLVGVNGKIFSVAIDTKEIKTFINNTGGIDGLESVGNNQYIFSDWSGHIHLASPGKDKKLLLNTAKDTIQAADIEFCAERNLILVPTFFHNTVSAYEVTKK